MNQGMGGINCMINNLGEKQEKYEDIQIKSIPKKNVVFKTTAGLITSMVFDYGTTMDEVLKKYWELIGKPENIHSNRFCFLFNANIWSHWNSYCNGKISEYNRLFMGYG